jgi:RNA polymerase sigma-54 factor
MGKLVQTQQLKTKLSPQQILSATIHQLNTIDLESRILDELEANPALELEELEEEPVRDESPESSDEKNEEKEVDEKENDEPEFEWEEILSDSDSYEHFTPTRKLDETPIPIKATQSFSEMLQTQYLDLNPTDIQIKIAEEIIGNVDEDGYLSIEPILISDRMEIEEEDVVSVLKQIQTLDPPGIGARNLQECLLSQVDNAPENMLIRNILEIHYDDFANRKYEKIINYMACSHEEFNKSIEVIAQLNPKPGIGIENFVKDTIIPDLTVEETDDGWSISINDTILPELRVSSTYQQMLIGHKNRVEVVEFIQKKLDSANWFISAIQQRRQTMTKVMASIIKHQKSFFGKTEKQILTPMILKDVAEDIQMDISTISRVTNDKYVQTPFGIFELKSFFSEGISTESGNVVSNTIVKDKLAEIIKNENKAKPYGDEKLTELINQAGFKIARRTITKYREQLKIPIARLRKTFER